MSQSRKEMDMDKNFQIDEESLLDEEELMQLTPDYFKVYKKMFEELDDLEKARFGHPKGKGVGGVDVYALDMFDGMELYFYDDYAKLTVEQRAQLATMSNYRILVESESVGRPCIEQAGVLLNQPPDYDLIEWDMVEDYECIDILKKYGMQIFGLPGSPFRLR